MKQITDANTNKNTTVNSNPALDIDGNIYLRGPLTMNQMETLVSYRTNQTLYI